MSIPSSSIDAPEGTIVAVRPGRVTVRVDERFACPRCASGRGCGAGIFARGRPRTVEVTLPPGVSFRIGEPVRLSLEPERLLHVAWLVYGVPLLSLFGAAVFAAYLLPGEASDGRALGLAAAGLVVGGWWARRRLQRAGCAGRFVPSLDVSGRRRATTEDG
jgi:sigma-E factor negative regulatory protein RseC